MPTFTSAMVDAIAHPGVVSMTLPQGSGRGVCQLWQPLKARGVAL